MSRIICVLRNKIKTTRWKKSINKPLLDETRSPFDLEVSLRETPPVDMCSADRVAYLCERSVNKVTFLYKCSVLALWEACRSGKFLKLEPSVIERREKKIKYVAGCRGAVNEHICNLLLHSKNKRCSHWRVQLHVRQQQLALFCQLSNAKCLQLKCII